MFERVEESAQPAIVFARNFFKNPRMLGSVIPSSRYLVSHVLRDIDWSATRVVVEYGPGVGTITGEILKRMRPDARLLVFEVNDDFIDVLTRRFDDPRLQVVHRSASEVASVLQEMNLGSADCVISGIPFSIMTEEARENVLQGTRAALREGGIFIVYQFSGRVRPYLEKMFGAVHQVFEPRNILPARVFHCVKSSATAV